MRLQVLTFTAFALLASVSFGQKLEIGPAPQDGTVVIYDPVSGDLEFDSRGGAMTTFQLLSASSRFTEAPNELLNGLFDVNTARKIFKLEPAGFDTLSLPGALPAGLSPNDIIADLELDGSFAAGGALKDAPAVLLLVPEPTNVSLIAWAGLGLFGFRRRMMSV